MRRTAIRRSCSASVSAALTASSTLISTTRNSRNSSLRIASWIVSSGSSSCLARPPCRSLRSKSAGNASRQRLACFLATSIARGNRLHRTFTRIRLFVFTTEAISES